VRTICIKESEYIFLAFWSQNNTLARVIYGRAAHYRRLGVHVKVVLLKLYALGELPERLVGILEHLPQRRLHVIAGVAGVADKSRHMRCSHCRCCVAVSDIRHIALHLLLSRHDEPYRHACHHDGSGQEPHHTLVLRLPESIPGHFCLLIDFTLAEPHLVEIDAESDIQIVFLDKWVGVSLTTHPLKAEVYSGLECGHREAEAESYAVLAKLIAANLEIVVGHETAEAIVHTLQIAASEVGSVLEAQRILGAVGKLEVEFIAEAEILCLAPGLECIVELKHNPAAYLIVDTRAPLLGQRIVAFE